MKFLASQLFCDWATVRQTHKTRHKPFNDGFKNITNSDEQLVRRTPIWRSIKGEHGSSVQVRSDGETVCFDGNPSRFNRSENYHGFSLDQVKDQINKHLASVNLPPFSGGEMLQLSDGSYKYSGAIFSRIDMTGNLKTGSAVNRDTYQKFQQTQEYPKLEKHLYGPNVYYGKNSESRTIKIYDKALHLKKEVLKKSDDPSYIRELIAYCESEGILRFETKYRDFLRSLDIRKWHKATQKNLATKTIKDIQLMTDEIETPDYDGIPTPMLGTLLMYMTGIDVKARLSERTYYKHRKALKKFGYDISNQNIHLLQPKIKVITLEPAGVPDFYKHAQSI